MECVRFNGQFVKMCSIKGCVVFVGCGQLGLEVIRN